MNPYIFHVFLVRTEQMTHIVSYPFSRFHSDESVNYVTKYSNSTLMSNNRTQ
jgi:hypothetical protein